MKRYAKNMSGHESAQAARVTGISRSLAGGHMPLSGSRRSLLRASWRVLWGLLRDRIGGLRSAVRERLRGLLGRVSCRGLQRLVRETAFAGAVAGTLLCATSMAQAIELADVAAGRGGFVIWGREGCSCAGDVNGDGRADLVVGGHPAGVGYVVFGKESTEPVDLTTFGTGQGGFVVYCDKGETLLSSSGAGDVNGDGLADLVFGAVADAPRGSGSTYVVFGKPGTEAVDLAAVAGGSGGFVVRGTGAPGFVGHSASAAGDVNGDGLGDLLIGAPGDSLLLAGDTSPFEAGAVYVVLGKPGGAPVELSAVAAGQGGHAILGFEGKYHSELVVSDLGDVNGDGIHDLFVGSRGYFSNTSHVVFGKGGSEAVDLSLIAKGQGGFVIRGEPLGSRGSRSGFSISKIGDIDVNGDGLADIVIGAPYAEPGGRDRSGSTYVVFGKTTTDAVELAAVAAGQGGFAIRGEGAGDESGKSVAGVGDVNGDGLPDLLIGAWFASPGGTHWAGTSYVVFGKAATEVVELSSVAAGQGGFVIRGQGHGELSGTSVSGIGDMNGDGLADLIVGTPGGANDAGATYVVFGKATTETVELSAVAAGRGGFLIRGENVDDWSGESVSGVGDVNGDGIVDLIIGAKGADPAGKSYVVFGKATTDTVELSAVSAGMGGFVIQGEWSHSGFSVSGTGDVNGDGLADVIIGAPWSSPGGKNLAGTAYVVFGKTTTEAVELSAVTAGVGGFPIRGESAGDLSGWCVSGAGDVNGDGIPDSAIGTGGGAYTTTDGRAYVVFGPPREGIPRFRRGDANADNRVDIGDAIFVLSHLFAQGVAPTCNDAADANDDGAIDIADAIKILGHLFAHAGPLPAPGSTTCGVDPTTEDPLDCERPPVDCR